MRPNEIHRLKEYIERQKTFYLIPYSNGPHLRFEAKRGFWSVCSYEFRSYPEKIEVDDCEIYGVQVLRCYYEGGHVLAYEFNLDNFFQVKEATE